MGYSMQWHYATHAFCVNTADRTYVEFASTAVHEEKE